MNEDFLHYVWKFQKFDASRFYTSSNEKLHIVSPGSHNFNSGPDFFNAQIELDSQLWAGNIEIHIKSSDWYAHSHEVDPAYDSVILHVVWEHDVDVFRNDGTEIPTFIIKEHLPSNTLKQYKKLFSLEKKWINCENDIASVNNFIIDNWLERLYFERLQRKEEIILEALKDSQNHWEGLLFRMLCKNFGLKVNGNSFLSLAKSLDFSVVTKNSQDLNDLEALLMGQSGLLEFEKEDSYFQTLKQNYKYIQRKFQLDNSGVITPKYFRLRPSNFPTIRLSQLANLYVKEKNLFSKVILIENLEEFYKLFNISASNYWNTHYNFGVPSTDRKKLVTKSFINLLIINTIIPIKFCYARQQGKDISELILKLASVIPSEENSVVKKFNSIKQVAKCGYESQALLQLKNEYCDKNKCLQCAIGNFIISSEKS